MYSGQSLGRDTLVRMFIDNQLDDDKLATKCLFISSTFALFALDGR